MKMAEDWIVDVRKYAADADENVVGAIARYCGIALQSRDGSLVAMSDKKERELVRENFLKKKLALTDADSVLDDAVAAVGDRMKADRTKNRVTVYYLLAEQFGLLNVFGGASGAAGAVGTAGAAVAGLGAAGLAAMSGAANATTDAVGGAVSGAANLASDAASGVAGVATGAAAAVGGAVAGAAGLASGAASSAAGAVSGAAGKLGDMASAPLAAVNSSFDDDTSSGGIWGWLKWLLLAALVLALLFWLLRGCSNQEATPVADGSTAETAETVEGKATETAAPAAPTGSGVVAAERDGKPMLTVYFDTGKSDVSNDLSAAAAKVKEYVGSNAGAKLAVSGFNDPTGNAAINAELSKKRAQGVAKALEAVGIPAASIEMVKPADSTDTSGDNSAARRVEVTVQ
jgi:outer membrane protein OmpA-like peptidoglycan-associated protein